MSEVAAAAPPLRREIGTYDLGRPGPTLLVLGGIHGNEPAGVLAAQRVVATLRAARAPLPGRLVALAGNLAALAERRRFVARDLNRGWSRDAIAALRARDEAARTPEDREQLELLQWFEQVERTATGPILFVDLHTSSADGPPFLLFADTIDNRRIGMVTRVPVILGIEETIDGASLEWFADRGIAGFAVEGGRHEHPDAARNLEAVLWLLLRRLGMLREAGFDLGPHERQLQHAVAGAPPIVEIVHRRVIAPEDRFRMEPGFVNFARVERGRLLATDRSGEIRAPFDCHVMLPLYQALGDDGFFLARRVRPFWMGVARWLRALRAGALLRLLPGVRLDPADPNTLLVDPRIARWFAVELFHLLGYRRERRRGERLAFSRRNSLPGNRRL